MISKVLYGHSFRPACNYIMNKKESRVLDAVGVRGYDPNLMADDFELQHELHLQKKEACFHGILSFYPGEESQLNDELMATIAREYLDELGIKNTQYAIAKHTDRKHIHLHIIADLINNDGNVINDSFLGLKGKKIAQRLTEKYHLIPSNRKNFQYNNSERLNQYEAAKYRVFSLIAATLPKCKNMDELINKLNDRGVKTILKLNKSSSRPEGISFQFENYRFKGSKVDRLFSYNNLSKYFSFHQQTVDFKISDDFYSSAEKNTSQKPEEKTDSASIIATLINDIINEWISTIPDNLYTAGVQRKRKRKKKRKPHQW